MVHFARFLSAAVLVSVSAAAPMIPRDDSAIGAEEPVSAPNGIPTSDALPSATSSSSDSSQTAPSDGSMSGYGSSYQPPSYDGGYSSSLNYEATSTLMMDDTSTMMMDDTSTMMMDDTSTMMMDDTSTMMMDDTSTAWSSSETVYSYTTSAVYSQATYGSGSASWGGSGYNDCVQQCAASFAPPAATWAPSVTQSSSDSGSVSGGSGTTHTVIVAPSPGVLRYIPFAVNASVGDTVQFKWQAGPHTVTQSSALEVCNKTENAFASGQQNAGFVFNQVVNTTDPIWFYCGVPEHCQKGMFGGINIATGAASPATSNEYVPLSSVMANLTSDPDMAALYNYTQSQIPSNNTFASNWGLETNCANMTTDSMMQVATNVLYNQMLISQNPQLVTDRKFAVSNPASMSIPPDFAQNLAAAQPSSSSSNAAIAAPVTSSASSSTTAAAAAANTSAKSGAITITIPKAMAGLMALAATLLAI